MRSLLDDVSIVDDDDAVGTPSRVQPVCDHYGGRSLREDVEGLLHHRFGGKVQCGRRLVEQEEARLHERRSRQGDQLTLTCRQ